MEAFEDMLSRVWRVGRFESACLSFLPPIEAFGDRLQQESIIHFPTETFGGRPTEMTGWEVPQESLWRVRGAAPASWIPACAGMTIKRVGQGEFDESVGSPHCLSRWSFLPPIETFGDRRQQESMRSYRGNDLFLSSCALSRREVNRRHALHPPLAAPFPAYPDIPIEGSIGFGTSLQRPVVVPNLGCHKLSTFLQELIVVLDSFLIHFLRETMLLKISAQLTGVCYATIMGFTILTLLP